MGIKKTQVFDLCANLTNIASYSEYGDALLRGKTNNALKLNDTHLGTRYFVPSLEFTDSAGSTTINKKCGLDDGSIVDQYYVIDGVSKKPIDMPNDSKWNCNIDNKNHSCNGNGIIFSARANMKNFSSSEFMPTDKFNYVDEKYYKCKKIKLYTDASKKNTDTNYVSMYHADKLINAGMAEYATEPFVSYGSHYGDGIDHHNREWSDMQSIGASTQYNGVAKNRSHIVNGHDGMWSKHSFIQKDDGVTNGVIIGDYVIGANLANIRPGEGRLKTDSPGILSTESIIIPDIDEGPQNEYRNKKKEFDVISGFFLGSVTILGLFIVFKLLDIRALTKMRRT
jgi:hypothetical protein